MWRVISLELGLQVKGLRKAVGGFVKSPHGPNPSQRARES